MGALKLETNQGTKPQGRNLGLTVTSSLPGCPRETLKLIACHCHRHWCLPHSCNQVTSRVGQTGQQQIKLYVCCMRSRQQDPLCTYIFKYSHNVSDSDVFTTVVFMCVHFSFSAYVSCSSVPFLFLQVTCCICVHTEVPAHVALHVNTFTLSISR